MPSDAPAARHERQWDGFISYAQVPDKAVARALRDGIQAFGKSAFSLRRARVFLDDAALSPSSDLPRSLKDTLTASRKFILLCCPEAAQSKWVNREVQFWLDTHLSKDMLLVRTGGHLAWNDGRLDSTSDALPAVLRDAFDNEPAWLDLAWAREHDDLRRAPALRIAVGRLTSAILDLPLDEIEGDDVRSQRLLRRLRNGAVAGLIVLTAASAALAVWAEINRRTANRQTQVALQRSLALSARGAAAGTPSLANGQRAAAYALSAAMTTRGPETWDAASTALDALPRALIQRQTGVTTGAFEPGGVGFALAADRDVSLHGDAGEERWRTTFEKPVSALAWEPTTRRLVVLDADGDVTVLSDAGQRLSRLAGVTGRRQNAAVRPPAIRAVRGGLMAIVAPDGLTLVDLAGNQSRHVPAVIDRAIPCGDTEVWAQPDGAVMLADLSPAAVPRLVHRHDSRVTYLGCAVHGESIASVSERDVALWTRAGATSRQQLHGVAAMSLNAGGDRLAVSSSAVQQNGRLDVRQGVNETRLFADGLTAQAYWHTSLSYPSPVLAFHDDHLLIADDRTALLQVDARRLTRVDRLLTADQVDHLIGLSGPDDVLVVTKDGKIQAVNFSSAARRSLGRTTGWATSATVNDTRTAVLLLSMFDGADIQDQRRSATLITPSVTAAAVSFDPIVNDAVSFQAQGVLTLRALATGRTSVALTRTEPYESRGLFDVAGNFESIVVSEDGSRCALWGQDGALLTDLDGTMLWREPRESTQPEFVAKGKGVLFQQEAPVLLSATDGSRITLPFEFASPGTVKVDGGLHFVAQVTDERHEVWDIGARRRLYDAPANSSWSSVFTADGRSFVAATAAGAIDIVTLAGPTSIRHVPTSLEIDGELALAPSGRAVYVPAKEGVGRLDLASGALVMLSVPGSTQRVDVAPQDSGVIVGYPDGTVLVVDASGKVAGQLRLSDTLSAVVFTRDGSRAAIGSHDGGVRVVDMATGRLSADVRSDTGSVTDLAVSADGEWLMVSGLARTRLLPLDPYGRLCQRAVRPLSVNEWREIGGTGPVPPICQASSEHN